MLGSVRLGHCGGKRPRCFPGRGERAGPAQSAVPAARPRLQKRPRPLGQTQWLGPWDPGALLPDHWVDSAVASFLATTARRPNRLRGPSGYWGEMRHHALRRSCRRRRHSHSGRDRHHSRDGPLRPLSGAALGCGGAARALRRGRKSPRARRRRGKGERRGRAARRRA